MKAMTTTQTGSKTGKMIVGAINCALMVFASTPSIADVSARKPADSKNEFTKLVGHITQLNSTDPRVYGNAFVVGSEGCFVLTNVHVAYGNGKRDAETGEAELIENVDVGHTVNFSFDFDSKSGKFQKKMKAKVVEFGNYEHGTDRGLIGDIAILRLESCLGKSYAGLEFDRPVATKLIPTGNLMTVSASRDANGRVEMLVEQGCRSLPGTPATGMVLSNCETPPGTSGSMMLEEGQDGKWRLAGLNASQITLKNGSKIARSIYASAINKFVDPVIGGEAPMAIAPLADQRKPQSEQTAMGSTGSRTVVR